MIDYYAHSGNIDKGAGSPQLYADHVSYVYKTSIKHIKECLKRSPIKTEYKQFLIDVVKISAYWHDVGKLDDNAQKYLSRSSYSEEKMLNHVDAGVAICLSKYEETKNVVYIVSAFLIYCHHIGLQNWNKCIKQEETKDFIPKTIFTTTSKIRDNKDIADMYNIITEHITVSSYINAALPTYIQLSKRIMKFEPTPKCFYKFPTFTGLDIRMMFSCLVDADHTDTELFYSVNDPVVNYSKLFPAKRIGNLKKYVKNKSREVKNTVSKNRIESRNKLFNISLNHKELEGFIICDAPVGTGKTTANMATALKMAGYTKCDRIYNILPFTNIITQNVNVFRDSVLLKSEEPSNINEIHSKVEYEETYLRKYSHKWNAPINVSTAVQFFESLVKGNTSSIRKLHYFSNAVIVVDEYDKAISHIQWKYISILLKELNDKYNSHFILSSGTSVDYFKLFDVNIDKNDLLNTENYQYFMQLEKNRTTAIVNTTPLNSVEDFIQYIFEKIEEQQANSAVVVLNTIVNAIAIFERLKNTPNYKVYQISSSLTPKDRETNLNKIRAKTIDNSKIILVATSIIECGIDISFDVGFRQEAALESVLQFSGRVNRNSVNVNSKYYIFSLSSVREDIFTENPQQNASIKILNMMEEYTPEYCTEAVRLYLNGINEKINFNTLEKNKCFNTISEEFKVINNCTISILIDTEIALRIQEGKYVSATDISRNSIQLWMTKFEDVLEKIGGIEEITSQYGESYYVWKNDYDPEYYGIGRTLMDVKNMK